MSSNCRVSRHSSPSQKLGITPESIMPSKSTRYDFISNSNTPSSLIRTRRAPGAKIRYCRFQSGLSPASKQTVSYISAMMASRSFMTPYDSRRESCQLYRHANDIDHGRHAPALRNRVQSKNGDSDHRRQQRNRSDQDNHGHRNGSGD